MTVLQQVKDYYLRFAHPSAALVKDVVQKIIPATDVQSTIAPNDNNPKDEQRPLAVLPPDHRGRFISEQI